MTPEEARQRIAHICASLGHTDSRFRVAAGVLAGRRPGRRAVDDSALLDQVSALVGTGLSVRSACRFVARMTAPHHQVNAVCDRLRRKVRGINK